LSGYDYFLGLRPRLIWSALSALSNLLPSLGLSAEGAVLYQPGAKPQERKSDKKDKG